MMNLNPINPDVEDFSPNSDMDIDDDRQSYTKSPKVGSKDCTLMKLGKLLLLKSRQGDADEVRRLMSIGAPFTATMVGTSPLHWAVHYNHMEVTELLLKAGIARDAKNKVDRTPCHIAASKGFHSVLRLLLAYGADVNCKDMLRMTPLHWAAECGSVPCIQLLLNYGCDINCVNKFDKTALEIASENNHVEAARLIEATLKEDPTIRMAKVTHFKDGNKIIAIKNTRVVELDSKTSPTEPPAKKNCIGFFLTKPDPVTGLQSTIELINDNEPTEETKTEKEPPLNQESHENNRIPLVVTDDGKVILNSPKINANKILLKDSKILTKSKLVPVTTPKAVNSLSINNGKKIIKVDAAHLINMTKEKKLFIKPRFSQITENRTIQVPKVLLPNNEITIQVPKSTHNKTIQIRKPLHLNIEKTIQVPKVNAEESINASLQAALKEADELRRLLAAKEKEIDKYKRQLQNKSGPT